MTSYQSQLGEGEGIADELAESQRSISIAEFFEKNKHMLGFDSNARALVTAVKEAVDNALDACEEAKIKPGPDIYVKIEEAGDYYRLVVEDNGPGITKDEIPKVFGKLLYGSRFHKREQSLLPDQQVLIRRDGNVELVDIGTLCDAYVPDREGEGTVRIDDDVQAPCFDRTTGAVTWQDVTHAIRHETDHDAYRIETSRGRSIEVTGNHSLFGLDGDGSIREVEAESLQPGDHVIAPETIPAPNDVEEVNLLSWIPRSELGDRRWYVYGIDRDRLETIRREGERVRKPASDGGRDRTYFRYRGVDVLKDSLEQNYLDDGYLPAEIVKDLGWEDVVSDGRIRTYQVGGETTEVPVTVELTSDFMRFLGLYVAEGHADARQAGFTFGTHERDLIAEVETAATELFGASTTTKQRERNSTRIKTFASPLTVFLKSVCGDGAKNKHVPPFVFRASPELQQAFIDALYDGDGSDSHPSNELSYATTSERLARELSYLWSMRGVAASWKETTTESNISGGETTCYHVVVHGEDLDKSNEYDGSDTVTSRYRRIPASVVDDVAVGSVTHETVPASHAGVFLAAGLGSQLEYAERFVERARCALDGETPTDDYYRETLEEHGFLTSDGSPTDRLRDLWNRTERLSAFGDSDLCLLRVEDVTEVEPPEYVYDISVPGTGADENFVAGNHGALCVKNSRGQQGIGISAAVLYSQLTSGKPAKIISRPKGEAEAHYYELIVDTDENEPEISVDETRSWDRNHGTRIELEMEANMRARSTLHDYIQYTAVVNPHARITFDEPKLDEEVVFERADDAELPDETEEIRPHPHGVELGTLIKMLETTDSYSVSGFLQEEFTRVGQKTADGVIDNFRDRHYGREMAWRPPKAHEDVRVDRAVQEAVANKGADATADFADAVADAVGERDRLAHSDLVAVVDEEADRIEDEYGTTFGDTVREKAVAAAWAAVTDETASDLYELVDGATTTRKDDAAIRGLAERVAAKFENRVDDDRHRVTRDDLSSFVAKSAADTEEYDGETFGETAREKVVDAIWEVMETVPDDPPRIGDIAGTRDTASELLEAMREADIISPPTDCLAPISAELVEEGLRKEFDADFYAASTRDASVHGGDPFIVEAGIAYGGDLDAEGSVEVMRFANRVPLVYQRGACATTDVVKDINWRNYGLDQPGGSGIPNGPAVVMVHVASTNVPFTSESKDAVANVPEMESEIELAIREAARELKSYLNKRRSMQKRRKKQNKLATILPEMAEKLAEVTEREELDIDDSLARIMNNVLVERTRENGTVELVVENNSDANADVEVTDIVTADPGDVEGATVVEMDDEWFLKWSPTVASGEEATLEYELPDDADCTVSVDGVEDEKLTVNA